MTDFGIKRDRPVWKLQEYKFQLIMSQLNQTHHTCALSYMPKAHSTCMQLRVLEPITCDHVDLNFSRTQL